MRYLFALLITVCSVNVFAQSNIDVQHYAFEIELSDLSDAITGKAIITVKFTTNSSVINFDLNSGADEKGMHVFQVQEGTQALRYTQQNDVLTIFLMQPAQINEVRTFEIRYMGTPADGLIISKNKYGDRTFFSDNWPNRAHNWIPCNDTPSDKATVEFIVKAPSRYKVISNGLLVEEKETGNNTKQTSWKETHVIPTKVMVIGVANFAVKQVDSGFHIPVTAWVYQQDSAKGFYDYALADDILKFFESYIGPYPYQKLANVQSKTIFGGMENANAIFYAENSVTGTRSSEALMAHEIAHQWFGNTATEKSFSHVWLSEGFATYMTDLYIEQKYGKDSFQKRMQDEREDVIGFIKHSELSVVDSVSSYMDLLSPNSYQKGAWFLHMLRLETGDSIFKQIIRTYYNSYKYSNADTRDFQKVAETVSDKNLKWFFDQWLYRSGIPELSITQKSTANEVILTVNQKYPFYKFNLPVVIQTANTTLKKKFLIDGAKASFRIKVKKPVQVFIDPDKELLFTRY